MLVTHVEVVVQGRTGRGGVWVERRGHCGAPDPKLRCQGAWEDKRGKWWQIIYLMAQDLRGREKSHPLGSQDKEGTNTPKEGWRYVSVVESPDCSSRGFEFSSQQPCGY